MSRKPTSVKDVLVNDFKQLSAQAVDLKSKINAAKTALKKDYFGKKLKKINKKVYSLMVELAMLEAKSKPVITPTASSPEAIDNDKI